MKRLVELSTKYRVLLLGFLKPLGFWGVGAVAVLDSSSIPVPMDLIVAGYAWSDPHRFYLYVLMAPSDRPLAASFLIGSGAPAARFSS